MAQTTKDIIKECLLQYHNEVLRPKLAEIEASIADSKKLAEKIEELKKALAANEIVDSLATSKINTIQQENTKQKLDITKLNKKLIEAEKQLKEANNTTALITAVKTAITELKTSDEDILIRLNSIEEFQDYYYNKLDRVIDILNMELDKIYSDISAVLPDVPTEDGSYTLKLTIESGVPTYIWIKE